MQCPQCHAENREGSRFCAECGASLAGACPDCGFANYPNAKFCGGCGKTLSAPSAPETTRKREAAEPERRQLTVMFCDLVGSSALAERLDPEELHQLLAQYQDACAEVIRRYEGYIARYVGDGLLVYFGYPQAHEDDAQRGVRAGLGIVDAIRDLETKMANPNVNLAVRIGITTGLVVAGDIGSGERVEEKAIVGETPNIAARLQALAKPNKVLIGASTQRLVEGLFDCDELGAQNLKGISQAVTAYRVRAESSAPSRFEASATRRLTPLVGREAEIGLLLNRWGQAKDAEGQVVLLSGEAGVGKSRIVRAFRDRLEAEPLNRVLYYGSPYHQNSPLYPAIDQLERRLRFEKDDETTQKLDKLDVVLNDLSLPVADCAPVLASLLSLPIDRRYPALELDPGQLKKKTLEALVAMIQAMSSQQPVLMVVEDVHWIDPSTQELISLLIEQLQSTRSLLLLTFRPEFQSRWGGYTHCTSLTFNRLSRKESAAMITKVTKGKTLPDEVLDQIIGKTDGVPLFIEELTKTVLESDLLKDSGDRYVLSGPLPALAIPASLQDSLMARLDRLAPVKEVAQLAAALGRTFTHQLLAAVSPLDDKELEDALSQLVQAELIYRRGLPPDVTYEFKHTLVQDAAYQSLLKSKRQRYHQKIARALEEQVATTAETEPEVLAYHYTEAGLAEQAIPLWHRAGQRAAERSADVEAIGHITRALNLIEGLPDTPDRAAQELALRITLGSALMSTKGSGSEEVIQTYLRARGLCDRAGQPEQHFAVLWGLWFCRHTGRQYESAQQMADELIALGQQLPDSTFLLQGHHAGWSTRGQSGDFTKALDHIEQGLAIYDIDRHRASAYVYAGHDAGVCAWTDGAVIAWLVGYPDRAVAHAQKGLTLADTLSHPYSSAAAQCYAAILHQFRGEPSAVAGQAEQLVAYCEEKQLPIWLMNATVLLGWALAALGQTEKGIEMMQAAIDERRAKNLWRRQGYYLAIFAEMLGRVAEVERGLDAISEALRLMDQAYDQRWEAMIHGVHGELLAQSTKNYSRAEACFQKSLEIAQRQNAKSLELRAAVSLGRLWRNQGKQAEARDLLAPVYGWFTEGFDTADLKEAKALTEELS